MPSILRVDALKHIADSAVEHLTAGRHSAVVGAAGVGTTTARQLIQEALAAADIPLRPFDCIAGSGDFARRLRAAAREFTKPTRGGPNVFLIDHAPSVRTISICS